MIGGFSPKTRKENLEGNSVVLPKGILLRLATEDDCAEITKLDMTIFPNSNRFEEVAGAILDFLFHYRSYVATKDDKIVGYAIINTGTDRGVSFSDLVTFGVDALYQGQGIGTMLLEIVITECIGYEIDLIKLHVNVENRAVRLYHSMGFRFITTKPDYYFDSNDASWLGNQSRDAYLMCKTFKDRDLIQKQNLGLQND